MKRGPSQADPAQPVSPPRRAPVVLLATLEANRLMLKTMFELNEVEVIVAADGEAAIKAAVQKRPDLILMDLNLPRLGGMAGLRRICACTGLQPVPLVLLADDDGDGLRKAARQAGCADLLLKPISGYDFYRTLKRYLCSPGCRQEANKFQSTNA